MEEKLQNSESMKHKCNETLARVILALDGELNDTEEKALLGDLERCSYCLEKYNIEKEYKEFLSRKMEKKVCAESLKVEIKEQIHRLASGTA
jgi:mycothiol system anti-sigma-R factor